ncbi:MAG TPA: hypothetical protein VF870_08820 [Ignavibacteriaceae bacterium]
MNSVKVLSLKIFLVMFSTLLVFGCSQSNKITDSWVNPDATKESIKFKKVAVFGLVMKTATRKLIEEQLARRLVNTIAVPSYKVVSDDDISKPEVVKAKLVEQGFDGALILRLVDIEKRESYSPGVYPSYYYSFGGFYGYSYGYMYNYTQDYGGQYMTDQIVTAEIAIYSLSSDKLIWTGETMSMNPNDVEKTIAELSENVKEQLIDDGLLAKENF